MKKIEIEESLYITSDRCLWYKSQDTVILSDIHFGYGEEVRERAFYSCSFQKEKILEDLSNIKNRYDPERFVVLGDFKHNFGKSESQEFGDLLDIIDYMLDGTSLMIIRGNHDNYLENLAKYKSIPFHEKKKKMGFLELTHGHIKVDWQDMLVIGHEHPAIELNHSLGTKIKFPVFLHEPEENIIVLPSFNRSIRGKDVLRQRSFFSPNLKNISSENFGIYAVSEEGLKDLRTIKNIREAL